MNEAGTVVWVTGLSGAGKTTICDALAAQLGDSVPELVRLDGDVVRDVFGDGLGHKVEDRVQQIGRMQRLAKAMADQGKLVLVAALYSDEELLSWNRAHLPHYFEVYVDASLALVAARDPKGLYRRARAGEMPDVVGIDIVWHPPKAPDLVIHATDTSAPKDYAEMIAKRIPRLARAWAESHTKDLT